MVNGMYYSLSRYIGDGKGAGGKAPGDINRTLQNSGWEVFQVYTREYKATKGIETWFLLKRMQRKITEKDALLIQWPLYISRWINVDNLFSFKTHKKIVLIHDIESLRFDPEDINKQKYEIGLLDRFDVIIAHNERMKQWLHLMGITKPIVSLEVFDYLLDTIENAPFMNDHAYTVCFAGNLEKACFIKKINEIIKTPIGLYGNRPSYNMSNNVKYKGSFKPEELGKVMTEDFGLLWDGESVEECSGTMGNYMKYNNPHKLSLYLACRKPVIVWEKAAVAEFVKKYKVGITIKSLLDLDKIINNITSHEYQTMKTNASNISYKITDGYFTKKAIEKSLAYFK